MWIQVWDSVIGERNHSHSVLKLALKKRVLFEVGSKKGLVWSERVWFGDPPTSSLSSVDFFLSVDGLELFE